MAFKGNSMRLRFPVKDISLKEADAVPSVREPLFSGDLWQVTNTEFALQVPGVGDFYVRDGRDIIYRTVAGADPEWVKLYLYGQVLVALLHQRKIISFHASSFIHNGRGIMILGETGAGKSSLTVSFALAGSGFLNDDLTPVIFKKSKPFIWPLYRDIKLREDTVSQLGISSEKLREAEAGTGKQYLDVSRANVSNHPLHIIIRIEIGDNHTVEFQEPSHAEKFSLLRSEICSWEILAGMPETEAAYLQQLVKIVEQVKVVRVIRPAAIEIRRFHGTVTNYLARI
jgi:hypothetical protein